MNRRNTKHGMYRTRVYCCWNDMKQRCFNPNNKAYPNYGARGIKVCDDWLDKENGFMNFYNWAMENGYQDNLTLDRIDVNGNYEPSNCRWLTIQEQQFNKTTNHLITFNEKTQTTAEWGKELNISPILLSSRLNKLNWSIEKALSTPVKNRFNYIIEQYDANDTLIKVWNSAREIERELKYPHNCIIRSCKNNKKYKDSFWKIKGITSLEFK